MANVLQVVACCPPVSRADIGAEMAADLADSLKALADPSRIRLLSLILSQADGEACVCHLTEPLGLTQPTVTHHLRVLEDAGFLTHEKRGRWVFYRAVPEALTGLMTVLATAPKRPRVDRSA